MDWNGSSVRCEECNQESCISEDVVITRHSLTCSQARDVAREIMRKALESSIRALHEGLITTRVMIDRCEEELASLGGPTDE